MHSKTTTQTSWLDHLKSTFDFDTFISSFDLSFNGVMRLMVYLSGGFFAGFFFKKTMRYLLLSIIITIASLYVLNEFHIVAVDIVKLKALFGIKESDTFQMILSNALEWMKNNIPIVLSVSIGFIIGYKVG